MRPSDIVPALDRLSAIQLPAMMWGSPGIGKSSVIHQIGSDNDRKIHDIRLALLDPTDLRGIPFYNPRTNSAEWAPSSILPKEMPEGFEEALKDYLKKKETKELTDVNNGISLETDSTGSVVLHFTDRQIEEIMDDQNAVLFLDEINAAPPVIQAASYQLVLDRRIGGYKLPDGVSIIAAGNNEGDKAVTFKMPTPLLNRLVHIDYTINFEDWHDWAVKRKIEADVVSFLNFKKGYLNQFDANSKSRGFPTPRSWEFVSKILDKSLPDVVLRGLVAGSIGEGAAIEFLKHREVYLKLPDPGDVLDKKVKKMKEHSISAAYAMIMALSYELKDRFEKHGKSKAYLDMIAVYFEFIHENFKPEFCIMGVRDCLKTFNLPMVQAPNWKKFAQSYSKIVMAA